MLSNGCRIRAVTSELDSISDSNSESKSRPKNIFWPDPKYILSRPKLDFLDQELAQEPSPENGTVVQKLGPEIDYGNQLKSSAQKARPLWRAYTKLTRTNFLVQLLDQLLSPGFGISLESIFWTQKLVQFLIQNFLKLQKKIQPGPTKPFSQTQKKPRPRE